MSKITDFKVGVVTHYFDKLGVAIIDLTGPLHNGDFIRISGSDDFSQKIESMQVEHEQVTEGIKGDTVGIKVLKPVKGGDEVIKTS